MPKLNSVAAATIATAAIATATLGAAYATQSTGNPAFDAGTRAASTHGTPAPASPEPAPKVQPMPFGFNPGDCPTEDSCRADYRGDSDSWVIVPVTP